MDETKTTNLEFTQNLISALAGQLTTEEDMQLFFENLVATYTKPPSERYDDDFFFDIIKPALKTLIRFKDDTAKELRYFKGFIQEKNCANEGTDYAVEILENVLESVDDILAGYDVQPFRCEGSNFNPLRQSAVKKLAADNPNQIKTVAESLSDGYERRGFVISKERVAAYSAKPNTEEEA